MSPSSPKKNSKSIDEKMVPSRFFNREFSWLAFNHRVLDEANNINNPIIERVRFLAISDANLEEFFTVRVAGLKGQLEAGIDQPSIDGLSPSEQLKEISKLATSLLQRLQQTWNKIESDLSSQGIQILPIDKLTSGELSWLKTYFMNYVFAALTPLAIDPAHPFPFIPNDGFVMILKLRKPQKQKIHWALLPLPKTLPRLMQLQDDTAKNTKDSDRNRFVFLEDVVPLLFEQLFPGFDVLNTGLAHVIRDSEIEINEEVDDLVEMFRDALRRRRRGNVIRLVVNKGFPEDMMSFLVDELDVAKEDLYLAETRLNLSDLTELTGYRFPPEYFFPRYLPQPALRLSDPDEDCFSVIRRGDVLVYHPYESFEAVVQFLRQAARDPNVLAIKQTLYRTTANSPIAKALIEAAEAGKSVTAVVELKARFDEETNIHIAHSLERAGVHVVYGVIGLKTHAKISLVVRREPRGIVNYVHFGTGNYHPVTTKIYTDTSIFTCEKILCDDAVKVLNYVTGYGVPESLQKLRISPLNLQDELLNRIEYETELARAGKPAAIWAKLNALVDPTLIDALYKASQAGVQIDLVVRGMCCLKPGVKGMSETIRVKSIVGRFLEHARLIVFSQGEKLPNLNAAVFMSSADWMPRNFYSRVETLVPIEDVKLHQQAQHVLLANLLDKKQSWYLDETGRYHRDTTLDKQAFSAQEYFMDNPHLLSRHMTPELKKAFNL